MGNIKLTKEQRLTIYKTIISIGNIWGLGEPTGLNPVQFLDRIWNLRLMSSSDPRYKTAAEDAKKHLIDNDDWDDDYVFLDRFKLLDCNEEEFLKFLNVVISPDVRISEDEIEKYVKVIEDLLPTGYKVISSTDKEGRLIYHVIAAINNADDGDQYPIGLSKNVITFFTDKTPSKYPAFQLNSDNWDDYGFKTSFKLSYRPEKGTCHVIGWLKILQEKTESGRTKLPDSFTSLPTSFCSLGQNESYYKELLKFIPDRYESVLYALKDAAWFSDIRYRFENNVGFKTSLLRNDDTTFILSSIKRKIKRAGEDSWDFSIKSELPYAKELLDIPFKFGDLESENNYNRIKALIGPNGAGKTSILKSLVKGLIRNENVFQPSQPVFSKVIAISFSIFDTFIELRGKSVLTYTYCGLHDKSNTVMSEEDRESRLKGALEWINGGIEGKGSGNHKLIRKFMKGLEIVFPTDWVDSVWSDDGISINAILAKSKVMSTGESMILNLIASLYANIRPHSLIVFDEMEVHLHPKAIRQMMSLLFKITREYNSACIIATHSSIVVQELLADNVIIIEKSENSIPIARILNHESLAENLSIISGEIFGESSIPPHYEIFIKNMAEDSDSLESLLCKLSSRNLPPSLPLYMLARNEFVKAQKK
ncbi:MAG: ATP-binding protein [Bacteroides sp.]|nr:ATP-binding protein [Bacteroides sp.]